MLSSAPSVPMDGLMTHIWLRVLSRTRPTELAEDRAAYVRARPLNDVQREQMVLDYVGAYGRVTRSQVADLCHLTPTEARRTLRRLVDRRALELRGERRGAHYVLPGEAGQP